MDEITKVPGLEDSAEDEPRIVTLLDEEGNAHDFEHVDSFEFNGEIYVCLIPADDGGEADEVLIFTLNTDDEGNEALALVEDEAELDMAFEEFKNRMHEAFDFE